MSTLREYIEARCIPVPFVGCWMWLRSFGSHGYGNAYNGITVVVAHRLSYEAFKGAIPSGVLVQHSCDNKWCVNPDHLSLGTDATNAVDKQLKGRAAKKLNASDVMRIKLALLMGERQVSIARRFGVDSSMVQRIAARKAWLHVDEIEPLSSEWFQEVNRLVGEAS